jgi:hypothetical protein
MLEQYVVYVCTHYDPLGRPVMADKKIGITSNTNTLPSRIGALKRGSGTIMPTGLKLVTAWVFDDPVAAKVEKLLHQFFSDMRTNGEWFLDNHNTLVDKVRDFISNLRYTYTELNEHDEYMHTEPEVILETPTSIKQIHELDPNALIVVHGSSQNSKDFSIQASVLNKKSFAWRASKTNVNQCTKIYMAEAIGTSKVRRVIAEGIIDFAETVSNTEIQDEYSTRELSPDFDHNNGRISIMLKSAEFVTPYLISVPSESSVIYYTNNAISKTTKG